MIQIIEECKNAYCKIIICEGRVLGAMLVGNTTATATLVQLFDRDDPLPSDPLQALCQIQAGGVASADRVVCNCHKISEGAVCEAIAAGADSVAALGEATKAGTGCGSCKGELAQLCASRAKKAGALPMLATG